MPEPVQGPACYFPPIETKYGRPISYRLDLTGSSPLTKHTEPVDWLKAGYGIGHGHASALAGHALAQRAEGTPQQPDHPSSGKDRT